MTPSADPRELFSRFGGNPVITAAHFPGWSEGRGGGALVMARSYGDDPVATRARRRLPSMARARKGPDQPFYFSQSRPLGGRGFGVLHLLSLGRYEEALAAIERAQKLAQGGPSERYSDEDPLAAANTGKASSGSSRYDPLRRFLEGRREPMVRLSFAEIERIIGIRLPDSARRHRPWWANQRSGSQAQAWMGAGRGTANVDLNAGTVDFVR